VKHHEALQTLLRMVPGIVIGQPFAAMEHVSGCSDCWAMLCNVFELMTGKPAPESEPLGIALRCDAWMADLLLHSANEEETDAPTHADLAAHLGWCEPCRNRLAVIRSVQKRDAAGEFGPLFET
jgi:hypothetical protein